MDFVESMFSVREVPWHGLGTIVQDAPNSAEALKLAGLDWVVEPHNVLDAVNGNVINNVYSNTRSSDGSSLGIVTGSYKIVQNAEAFEFTDNLIGTGDVKYETAGSLKNGRVIWLLAKMPEMDVLGDKVDNYVCFSNSFDGSASVRVCCTPVRVVCNNTLNMALKNASRTWSMRHKGDIKGKLEEARQTLELATNYQKALQVEADVLANSTVTEEELGKIITNLFPIDESMTDRAKGIAEDSRASFIRCYNMDDIKQFKGTKWGVINAVSDFVAHTQPARLTDTYQENNWGRIMNGHPVFDKAYDLVKAM